MEYRYARHNGGSGGKDVAHIWEIGEQARPCLRAATVRTANKFTTLACAGGDTTLSELLSVPITPQRLPSASAVVVVDLSKPHTVVAIAAAWLKQVHSRAQECLDKMKARNPKSHAAVQQAALARTTACLPAGVGGASQGGGGGGGQHPDV
jgi:hypothetical protein